jgi:hypothetical protein
MAQTIHRRGALLSMLGAAGLTTLGACSPRTAVGPDAIAGQVPDATVELQQVQVAYIGSGSTGRGVLHHRGRSYPFSVSGLGAGGIGASTIEASGEVYRLPDVSRFAGVYAQGRYGFALGRASAGEMWLQNEAGVVMRLVARREGLMLSLGGDAVLVTLQR